MTSTYVEITREEMEETLSALGFKEIIISSGEHVYDRVTNLNGVRSTLRVYSSVTMRADTGREKGADRIRIILIREFRNTNRKPAHIKVAKMNRVRGWKMRLQTRLLDAIRLYKLHNTEDCVECGHESNGYTDDGKPVCAYHQDHIIPQWTAVNEATLIAPEPVCVVVSASI